MIRLDLKEFNFEESVKAWKNEKKMIFLLDIQVGESVWNIMKINNLSIY